MMTMAPVDEATNLRTGDILVAFAATDAGARDWRLRGDEWAYGNDAACAGEGEFPLWKYLYRSTKTGVAGERSVFMGPNADPSVTVVFAGFNESYEPGRKYRRGNGINSLEDDFTLEEVAPPLFFVNIPRRRDTTDGRVTFIDQAGRAVVTSELATAAVFETVRQGLRWFTDAPSRQSRSSHGTHGELPEPPYTDATSVGELVALTYVERLPSHVVPFLEPLLGLCDEGLDSGALDEPTAHTLEEDRAYLRRQLYRSETGLDTAIVNAVARRMLRLLSPALLKADERSLVEGLLDAGPDAADVDDAIKAADHIAASIDDKAVQSTSSIHEWVAIQLGWYRHAAGVTAAGAYVTIREEGGGFLALSGGVTTLLVALGVSGPAAVLAAVYIALLARSWRNTRP
jgi:hypothetical protein